MTAATLPSTGAVTGLGETLAFFRDPSFSQRRFRELGDVFETKLLAQSIVFIRGERAISDLLKQEYSLQGWWPESVRQLLGSRSLANRNGADHKARRRVVGQLFSSAALSRYRPSIESLVNDLAEELQQADGPIPLAARMRRFAFSVIATTVLGLEATNRDALFADFEIWTRALFSIPLALPGTPFAKALDAKKRLLDRLKTVLQTNSSSEQDGLDLLSGGLDEAGLPLDDDDLVEQLLLLLFAGYETTASSLSCLFRALLLNPEVEHWLMQDSTPSDQPIEAGCNRSGGDAHDATRGRLLPAKHPVNRAGERRDSPGKGDSGGAQRIERTGPDGPGDLRPQRHLDGSFQQTLLPFGGGERVCLGKALAELEIRLMTVGLLQRVQQHLEPDQDLNLQLIPSPTPRDGLLVTATAR